MEREAQAYTDHEIGAGPFHVPAGSWAEMCLFFRMNGPNFVDNRERLM